MERLSLSSSLAYVVTASAEGHSPAILDSTGKVIADTPQDILSLIPKEHLGAFRLGLYCSSLISRRKPTSSMEVA